MPMPYTLTKGPLLTLLENALNPQTPAEVAVRNDSLQDLRNGTPIAQIPWVTGTGSTVQLPNGTLDIRLDTDWFGNQSGGLSGQTTGYWVGYHGDVESVLREGLIRAIEVSLGIDHAQPPSAGSRTWPIEVQWKCPNPYFEVWVTWRRHAMDPDQGQVTMIVATPPDKANRLVTDPRQPPTFPGVVPVSTPLEEPTSANESQGMWLVTHAQHEQHTVDHLVEFGHGDMTEDVLVDEVGALFGRRKLIWAIPMPSTFWEDTGDVVVVAPPPYAGGADPSHTNAP